MAQSFRLRRGTAAQWTAANPVLAQGEPGFETDTNVFKFGDGVTAWASLARAALPEAQVETLADERARRLYLAGETLASVQTWLNGIASGDVAQLVGTISYSGTLTVPAGVTLDLSSAHLTQTDPLVSTVVLSGEGSSLRGGKITNPATFSAATGPWTYAVVYVTGKSATVDGVTLVNVPHVGIGIKEVDDVTVTKCHIYGNYPAASYNPATTTGHFAIALDTNVLGTGSGSGPIITGNHIHTSIQGISLVNHGSGFGYGSVVAGNRFYGCHNHGIYSQYGMEANSITGNVFFFCQKPVVTYGRGHVIQGNAMYNLGNDNERDYTGISCRDAVDCVVANNTIYGQSTTTNIAIQLDQSTTSTATSRNAVRGNVIYLFGSGGNAAIRVGTTTTTECRENRVEGNIIRAPGYTGGGVIEFVMEGASLGAGNSIEGNHVVCVGNSHHIKVDRQVYASIRNNYLRHDKDETVPTTVIHVRLSTVSDSIVEGNRFVVTASWGANTGFRGTQEVDAACDRNVLGPNVVRHSLAKATSSTEVVQASPGNASLIGHRVGEHASATTLGSVTGKVEVRDGKGAILGYLPVYGSIT